MKTNWVNQESLWFAIFLPMKKERERAVYLSCILPFMRVFISYGASFSWYHWLVCDL